MTPERGADAHIRLCFAGLEAARLATGVSRLAEAVDEAWQRGHGAARREPAAPMSVV
jgi:hypothetical protein